MPENFRNPRYISRKFHPREITVHRRRFDPRRIWYREFGPIKFTTKSNQSYLPIGLIARRVKRSRQISSGRDERTESTSCSLAVRPSARVFGTPLPYGCLTHSQPLCAVDTHGGLISGGTWSSIARVILRLIILSLRATVPFSHSNVSRRPVFWEQLVGIYVE